MSINSKPNISLFFPVYNDENTVELVFNKALTVLKANADQFEIIIINDGSPDRSGEVADRLQKQYPDVLRVIHHPTNLGYGAAIRSGLKAVQYEWVCFTDGDDEYDVHDLTKLLRLRQYYELIITFRYVRVYSSKRIFISVFYNMALRMLFRTNFRDISTGLRLMKKDIIPELDLISNSPFIGAEITIKSMLKGFPVGEVGIQTFKREFGRGASVTIRNIIATIRDMLRVHRMVFSLRYDLPKDRERK